MEQKTQAEDAKAKAKREARQHMIFGAIATVVIIGLIALMFAIEDYGQRTIPGAQIQTRNAADDH